jgi:CRISPR-associated endonuclease/helicase Cas3
MPALLLAKSPIPGQPPKTLLAHTQEVMAAVEYLYGTENRPSRLAREWLRFFRLEATNYNRFRITRACRGTEIGGLGQRFQPKEHQVLVLG